MRARYAAITLLSFSTLGCATVAPVKRAGETPPKRAGGLQEKRMRSSRLAGCLAALDGEADPDKVWQTFARCMSASGVYAEPACNRAWARVNKAFPPASTWLIVDACTTACCPNLEPKPRLCERIPRRSSIHDALDWVEFHLRVLTPALGLSERPALLAKLTAYLAGFVSIGGPPMEVELPKAAGGPKDPDLVIAVGKDGGLTLDGKAVKAAALEEALKARYRASPGIRILIQAHRETTHGAVVRVMDLAKSVGFRRLGVSVRKSD